MKNETSEDTCKGKLCKAMWIDLFEKLDHCHDVIREKLKQKHVVDTDTFIGSEGSFKLSEK